MGSGSATLPAKRSIPFTDNRMDDPSSLNGSSKRSKKPPLQQQQQQPLVVPPGHVAFRLLCHASRIGGVIGKSGSVIKQLQQATGSKIRVENAPAESPDRVVAVVAPSAVVAKISLKSPVGGGGDGGGEEMEVSKAQEALLKVFDRILEVAAESGAVGASIGVVSCRLLADAAQAGSVIGKGGKIVEKIRKDSGCKIRVLTEKLPACAASTDEMIEIEGNVLAVKKALVAVSRRVQDCPSVDKTKAVGNRQLEAVVPQETLPDLRMEHLSHRNLMLPTYTTSSLSLPTSSISYVSGVRPLALESERITALEEKMQPQEVSFRILCENDRVGSVIGKGGSVIRALQSDTGANVSVGVSLADCDERLITVSASENPESRYSPAQKAVVLVFSRFLEASSEKGQDSGNKGSSVTARLVVPSNQVGCLLGKGGAIVSEMRKVTGANIRVIGGDQVPKCVTEKDVVVQISGDFSSVQDALYNATGRLRDNLLSSIVNSAATRNASSLLTNTSPYARMRDPAPPGINTSPPIGVTHSFTQHSTLSKGLDHLGLSHTLDHPSSPRQWESQMMAGVSTRGFSEAGGGFSNAVRGFSDASRGFSDAGRGLSDAGRGFSDAIRGFSDASRGLTSLKGGLELGSGSKSAAIVTNTTVEIVVPENVIGSVYGENGNNLTRLRQISGARVIVHEPRPGTSDRIIVISGTPDETQAAQSLLHAFILTGPS
ncbi:KH domain-containing protein HEN4 isoform X2 [Humulus lupulus]|uniref:KH domain-containing protein HEN4 isoform X2 n=1 Tax=Humulus lupulus TaxID=3486 RepID=UPI002B403165|nr:KH domain-containing protein HEN4 isoform X2 [Humulus lupulus]